MGRGLLDCLHQLCKHVYMIVAGGARKKRNPSFNLFLRFAHAALSPGTNSCMKKSTAGLFGKKGMRGVSDTDKETINS